MYVTCIYVFFGNCIFIFTLYLYVVGVSRFPSTWYINFNAYLLFTKGLSQRQ